jgi:hypothetical protein
MTERTTAAEWTERVRAWGESGRTAREFAAGKGYSDKLLQWWGSELARRERRKPAAVKLARVVRVPAPSAALTVAVGDARIEIRGGFDAALLRDVVGALGGAR